MKDLVKPANLESVFRTVEAFSGYCELDCSRPGGGVCQKFCARGGNYSPTHENDILF